MTPLLIFIGVPAPVAVGTEANQIVASSVSGVIAHWRRGNVDFKMGAVLLIGGFLGSTAGVALFAFLRTVGQIDLVVIALLCGVPRHHRRAHAVQESVRTIMRARAPARGAANCISTIGCMVCRSSCAFANQSSTSVRSCRWPSAFLSVCCRL